MLKFKGKDVHQIYLTTFQDITLDCACFLGHISKYDTNHFPLRNYLCAVIECKAG